jgi:membrane-bound serine protease (ClpP class)
MLLVLGAVLALVFLAWPWNAVTIAAAAASEFGVNVVQMRWMRRRRAAVGVETLVGTTALALTPLAPDGQVKINGEIWRAHADHAVQPGQPVRVRAINGLTLEVEPT